MKDFIRRLFGSPPIGQTSQPPANALAREADRLVRRCLVLRPIGEGEIAARWYAEDLEDGPMSGFRKWITFDLSKVPTEGTRQVGFATVYTSIQLDREGRVVVSAEWPDFTGTALFGKETDSFPPPEAVAEFGKDLPTAAVDAIEYSPDGRALLDKFTNRHPFYDRESWAILGGWHIPWPEGDWRECAIHQLLLTTIADSEPWIEVFQSTDGRFVVKDRIS